MNYYYVAVLYSLKLKTVLLKYIGLNTPFFVILILKIFAIFGVNCVLLKSCKCKMRDI